MQPLISDLPETRERGPASVSRRWVGMRARGLDGRTQGELVIVKNEYRNLISNIGRLMAVKGEKSDKRKSERGTSVVRNLDRVVSRTQPSSRLRPPVETHDFNLE
ncbi:hypothetical protein GWI33_014442 [Rhynchophorus ferrugineus]|uniref:Uncharacterized protein n=1 Tax=Rhynchophorus ferrugineus TaxID=354439 RepID=A0A834M6W4_RHYFE|nr:hypothetical protein GWI33_014442 [Rhynchophorus ferrugineus]